MLIIVMENPIQLTIVREVPFESSAAFWATRVENKGESAITTRLHMKRKTMNWVAELEKRKNGETRQHKHDMKRAMEAIFFVPKCCESIPLKTHANAPEAIIKNDNSETLRLMAG